jgi:alkylated DNA nucleotide flippase Atl1
MRWHDNKHEGAKNFFEEDVARKMEGAPAAKVKRVGEGTLLIPHPTNVDAEIRKIRRGKVITQAELRERLARAAGADKACPITTGMFVRIVAEAAEEKLRAGKVRVTPYWRVVREGGRLMEKFPGGPAAQAGHLEAEGQTVDRSAKICLLK